MTLQASEIAANPFAVKTPETLSGEELVDLFVPYPEFENLQVSGHQFLNGHRGSGKSMMLRMMSPDSQILWRKCDLSQLPYFGVYLSIKATELNAPEYSRLEGEISGTILSEHVLTTKVLSALFLNIQAHCAEYIVSASLEGELRRVVTQTLFDKFRYAGWDRPLPQELDKELESVYSILEFIVRLIDQIHMGSVQYIKRLSLPGTPPYQGALLGFQDVLLPVIQRLSSCQIIPHAPVYLLLDDADNLTEQQTKILNTWVFYRTTGHVSLKISTQLNYKTFETVSGALIESPHDFSKINFTSVHTGSVKERYPEFVASIVEKRLTRYGSSITNPYDFFPDDKEQDLAIKKIAEEYRQKWEQGESGSSRPGDDAYRYARPEYIRRLTESRQGAHYHYAGFEQLVHMSSGIIRFFLEPAALMFTEQLLINKKKPVTFISHTVQDQVLRKQADQLLLGDFDHLAQQAEKHTKPIAEINDVEKLRNIVRGIGALFKSYIMDETATQRRNFSFQISDDPPQEIKKILKLGEIHGYFYMGGKNAKTGLERVPLYVLTRRLAPAFSLDPIGFSAHLTVTSKYLKDISEEPKKYINRLRKKRISNPYNDPAQLSLLEEDIDE